MTTGMKWMGTFGRDCGGGGGGGGGGQRRIDRKEEGTTVKWFG